MKISGFTIIRNGVLYAYPFKEAILSVLPLCDEFIVNVGKSDDATLDEIKALNEPKIKIIETEWDMSLRKGGKVLSVETNKALKECSGDWCFYIQSDEVLHEKYIPEIKYNLEKYLNNDNVDGLRFNYKHFYGSYDYYQDNYRKWYIREVRIIKNKENIVSWGDAMDFRYPDGSKLKMKDINAEIFHYGWVKPPHKLLEKRAAFERLYHNDDKVNEIMNNVTTFDDLGNLKKYTGTHPSVMKKLISENNWKFDAKLDKQLPDWIRKILIFFHPILKRLN